MFYMSASLSNMVGSGIATYVSVLIYKHPVYVKKSNVYKDINFHQKTMVGSDNPINYSKISIFGGN